MTDNETTAKEILDNCSEYTPPSVREISLAEGYQKITEERGMDYLDTDEETMAMDQAAIDAIRPDIEAAWSAQAAAASIAVSAMPDDNKGRYLAPVARLRIGEDLEPEGLSKWGKQKFQMVLQEIRIAALKPLYSTQVTV